MAKKYQVFISSTFKGFERERKQVLGVVIDHGHIPVALERFSAVDESVRKIIERTIKQCQIYVVILGERYGSRSQKGGLSYTHLEFRAAEQAGLTILPFFLDNIEERRKKLKEEVKEKEARGNLNPEDRAWLEQEKIEAESDQDLRKFHDEVKRGRTPRPFSENDQDFSYYVSRALDEAERTTTKPGWIPEPTEPLVEGVLNNPFIRAVVKELSNMEALDNRVLDQVKKKNALAEAFVESYLEHIIERDVNLFFESGSTVAYVAEHLGTQGGKHLASKPAVRENGHLSTNNVLAFLQMWLIHRVPCALFPWAPPERTYGACFGLLEQLLPYNPPPQYPPEVLSAKAKTAIQHLREMNYSIAAWRQPSLLLGAVSGLQLGDTYPRSPDGLPEPICCKGPHVGSWRNKIFKRFMYDTGHPIMIFMTDDKIDSPIEIGKCHFILDEELPWPNFCKKLPLAFCVGCESRAAQAIADRFRDLGFHIADGKRYGEFTAVIARNARFIDDFEKTIGVTLRERG